MPILTVEIVDRQGQLLPLDLAQRVADACAPVLGISDPGRVWVRLRVLSESDYAENGAELPPGVGPVFAEVLLAEHPAQAELAQLAQGLASTVGRACSRPAENVHVLFLPPGKGRVAFGGELKE